MLFKQENSSASRAIPFAIGALFALLSFAVFSWDLGHHWNPYPGRKPPAWFGYFQYFWFLHAIYSLFTKRKTRRNAAGYWPRRNLGPPAPDSDNLGAIQTHRSEAAGEFPR